MADFTLDDMIGGPEAISWITETPMVADRGPRRRGGGPRQSQTDRRPQHRHLTRRLDADDILAPRARVPGWWSGLGEDGCASTSHDTGTGTASDGGGGRAVLRAGGHGVRGDQDDQPDGARLHRHGRRRRRGDAGGGRGVRAPAQVPPPRRRAPPGAHHAGLGLLHGHQVGGLQRGQHQPEEPALRRGEVVGVPDQDQDLRLPGRQRRRRGGA